MRRTINAVFVVLAAVGAGAPSCARVGGPPANARDIRTEGTQEQVNLVVVTSDADGTCKLKEKTPTEIRTQGGDTVTWTIKGTCRGSHNIAIDRKLKKNGQDHHDPFTGDAAIQTTATDGATMSGTLKPADEIRAGHYRYRVLIDGRAAEHASPADMGSFFMCPTWPCDIEFDY